MPGPVDVTRVWSGTLQVGDHTTEQTQLSAVTKGRHATVGLDNPSKVVHVVPLSDRVIATSRSFPIMTGRAQSRDRQILMSNRNGQQQSLPQIRTAPLVVREQQE